MIDNFEGRGFDQLGIDIVLYCLAAIGNFEGRGFDQLGIDSFNLPIQNQQFQGLKSFTYCVAVVPVLALLSFSSLSAIVHLPRPTSSLTLEVSALEFAYLVSGSRTKRRPLDQLQDNAMSEAQRQTRDQ